MKPLFGQTWGRRGIFGQVRGGATFTVTITGESTDSLGPYAQIGNHAAIGYTETPTSGIETVKWSNSSNPASAATYGTGANPTDFTAGDTGTLWLHVTIGSEVVSRSIPIRRLPATGGADLALSFVENVAISSTNLIANWTTNGNTLTFVSITPPLPPGLSINSAGTMTGTPTSVAADDTYTLTMQDANGRQVSDTLTLQVVVGVQATAVDLQEQEAGTGDVPAVISGDEGLYWWIFTTTDPDVNAPSRAQVVAGQTHTGSAAPASGTVTTIANPGTVPVPLPSGLSGTYFLVLADSDSVLWDGTGQVIDTTEPILSALVGTQTGQTTADWDVTSDKAGGTIYAGVRPSASAALTEAQLIAGSGGAGVDFDLDATPTADNANGGSFIGLTAATAYRVDSVHVDAFGNVSAVSTSAEFTTASANLVLTGIGSAPMNASSISTGPATANFTGVSIPGTAPRLLLSFACRPNGAIVSLTAAINGGSGTIMTRVGNNIGFLIIDRPAGTTMDVTIVGAAPQTGFQSVGDTQLYVTELSSATAFINDSDGINTDIQTTDTTYTADLNVPAGGAVHAVFYPRVTSNLTPSLVVLSNVDVDGSVGAGGGSSSRIWASRDSLSANPNYIISTTVRRTTSTDCSFGAISLGV